MAFRDHRSILLAVSILGLTACQPSEDGDQENQGSAYSHPLEFGAEGYSCWDGERMYAATAFLAPEQEGVLRYELRDKNAFAREVTPQNSSEWECHSDRAWEMKRRVYELCQDPLNMTDICRAEPAGER